ncbi:FadR/GntR family transcriptional regulator [Streptomyces sp. NPDC002779]|uniref:FadR/GntR family transcriptional regulator n=1 Tax=Streptomyces sp. NPDC002779 TaxID=3364664 RepID=UPI0036C1E3C9
MRDVLRLGGADLLPMLVGHSPDWIGELFEVRRSIGALIAERAAARATPAQVTELRALMTAVRAAQGGEAPQLADAEVHRALARATGNRVYVLLTNTLCNAYLPVRAALVGPFAEAEAAHARLAPVVDAVAAGDRAAAHATADAYLPATERIMLDDLARARDAEAAGELESAVRVGRDDGAAARRAMGRLLFAAGAEEVLTGVAHAEPRCGAGGRPSRVPAPRPGRPPIGAECVQWLPGQPYAHCSPSTGSNSPTNSSPPPLDAACDQSSSRSGRAE